ncbi:MAG TPA: amino acid permease [Pyrinomonadaceae bacterium]|nr:amino acid permease [Pyrinomonadaceae bacterium]
MEQQSSNHELVRGLGPIAAISINVGNIIGTGIFLKARVMTCNVGTPWRVILAWIAAGLLALAGALTYAELTTMRPHAGAEYVITKDAYGRVWGFLNGWSQFLISRTASAAALAVGFAIFMNNLLDGRIKAVWFTFTMPGFGHEVQLGSLTVIALITLAVTTAINCAAVSVSGHVASLITILKVLLVLGVGIAAFFYQGGDWANFGLASTASCEGEVTGAGLFGFSAAMVGALWAYDGWNNISYMAGEVKHPDRNLPLALIASMLIIIVLYVLVNVSYYYVMTPTEVASVDANATSVAAEAIRKMLGPLAVTLMAAVMMLSSWGSLQSSILGTARIPYAMARDGVFFQSLARVSKNTKVPVISLIVQGVWAGVLTLSGSFDQLTDMAIFAFWLFYGLVAGAVFVFRWREPDAARPYKTWGYPVVPALFLLTTIYLIATTIYNYPARSVIGLAIIAAGLPVYWYFATKNPQSPTPGPPLPPAEPGVGPDSIRD